MTNKLAGKIALVTGGSTGIGLATAKEFVAEGAYVFITGRREKELTEAVTTIGSNGTGVIADASKLNDLDILFERISKEKGRLDIVCERWRREFPAAWLDYRRTLRLDIRY